MNLQKTLPVLSVALFLIGCSGGDASAPDAGAPPKDITDVVDRQDTASEIRKDPDLSGPDTADITPDPRVRAFIITTADELLSGREATGRVGDLRIENDHLVAVIGAAGHHMWGPFGGGILDLAVQGGEDRFQEAFSSAGFLRTVRPDSIEVAADGTDGDAIIRVHGTDGAIPLVDLIMKTAPVGLDVTVEYSLSEDSPCLEVRTSATNPTDAPVTYALGDGFIWSETAKVFGPGAGYNPEGVLAQGAVTYIGADQPGLTHMVTPLDGASVSVALLEDELSLLSYEMGSLAPGETATVRRCIYATAGRSLAPLAIHWEAIGQATSTVSGTVQVVTEGYNLEDAVIEVYRDDEFIGSAAPAQDGTFSFQAPPGAYRGVLRGEALADTELTWTVEKDKAVDGLAFAPTAPCRIDLSLTDDDGVPIHGRFTIQAGPDAALAAGMAGVVMTLDGAAEIFLPAGTWTVTGSRGPQWEYCRGDVTVADGEGGAFTCAIHEELPTPGWITGDLHVHSEFSIDSNLPREERVKALITEGVRFFAATEHDVFADYRPIVESMGVADLLTASLGNEISPLMNHFNCLGCESVTNSYFEVEWMELDETGEVLGALTGPQIWALLKEDFDATMVQINHPRSSQGFLDHVNYDPAVGPSGVEPGAFDFTFDSMEVWNGNENWNHLSEHTLPDWYSFLNRGQRKIGVGNSDSHQIHQWIGQPRNLVLAEAATDEAFYAALKAGRSQATSAPFIEFSAGEATLGDTLVPDQPGDPITFTIRVSAPTWAPLDTVQLVGNGALIQEWDCGDAEGLVRLEVETDVAPPHDAWYHVIARAKVGDLAPLYPNRSSMAFTNPIWVDLDGDGFDPPIVD